MPYHIDTPNRAEENEKSVNIVVRFSDNFFVLEAVDSVINSFEYFSKSSFNILELYGFPFENL